MQFPRYILALATAAVISARVAAASYTITDLGALPVADSGTYAYALNNTGSVAGLSGNPFLWAGGTMRNLNPSLPASVFAPAPARDVNDANTVVGSFVSGATIHPFRWMNGAFTDLAPSAASPQYAISVNNRGDILVEANASYLLRADGTKALLGGFTAGAPLHPEALNDAGQVAGYALTADRANEAALWQDGVTLPLGVLPGDLNSDATAVNGLGAVAGISYGASATAANVRGWIWQDGVMAALPSRAPFESCVVTAMNDRGQVVGFVGVDARGGEKAALLWEGGAVRDLQALLPDGSGWTLRAARDINNAGQIAGYGVLNGAYHAFLMTPIPPPAVPGDANGDGKVTPQDAAIVMDIATGGRPLPPSAILDVAPSPSGDGKVDALDAVWILRQATMLPNG